MKKFTLNYHVGNGNTEHDTIEEAMKAVEPKYTKWHVTIDDENGEELAILRWCDYPHQPDFLPAHTDFGALGYYQQWTVYPTFDADGPYSKAMLRRVRGINVAQEVKKHNL